MIIQPPSRRGMVLLIVIGCLVFTMIVFASMVSRVSQESRLTARNSVNEDLYQLASAIGRLSLRRLGKIVENNDRRTNPEIYDAVFNGTPLKDRDFPDIMSTDVIESNDPAGLKVRYKDLKAVVKYSLEFDNPSSSSFPPDIEGLAQPPFERQGSIVVEVSVTANKHTKICKISKRFFTVRLLAAPFHKFTLFSPNGANIPQSTANSLSEVGEDGKLGPGDKPPLVLLNRLTQNISGNEIDFGANSALSNFIDEKAPIKNGWIYLGYNGKSKVVPDHLVLNVCTGDKNSYDQGYYGEAFHFFYEPKSTGWVGSLEWVNWINGQSSAASGKLMVLFNDYGHFACMSRDMPEVLRFPWAARPGKTPPPPIPRYPIFQNVIKSYVDSQSGEAYDKGSRLHLYGTPGKCTPTLVFGQVQRRFMRTFAFFFPAFGRTFPIRGVGAGGWDKYFDDEISIFAEYFGKEDYKLGSPIRDGIEKLIKTDIGYQTYLTGKPGLCRLAPTFMEENYNVGLKNLRFPQDPTKTFEACFPEVSNSYGKPDQLDKKNFEFRDDSQIHYKGPIDRLVPGSKYLAAKTSYYITDNPPELSKCKFLIDKKILIPGSGQKMTLFLNQVIRFKNALTIDVPLEVQKGGIIVCDEAIKIQQPIINPYLKSSSGWFGGLSKVLHPDTFGYVTLYSRKGIEIGNWAKNSGQIYPELHAFLMAMNGMDAKIKVSAPIHIKGGVAVDRLDQPPQDNLLEKGGIIEWGFEPDEIADGKDLTQRNFYGIAMGPRDVEIVQEE